MSPSVAAPPPQRAPSQDGRDATRRTAPSRIGTPADSWRSAGAPPRLLGRRAEHSALELLMEDVRARRSRVLVVRGEAGVGKTTLLNHLVDQSTGCLLLQASAAESEQALDYAGLQLLCAPVLDRLQRLPAPQRHALATAFGLRTGARPDPFFVGLATLGLLRTSAADHDGLVCVLDDAQWLDRPSARTLAFVARRLVAEPIGVVLAMRGPAAEEDLNRLPELALTGLADDDAHALLESALHGPLDAGVRARMVAETRGNPGALLEMLRDLTPAELAFGIGLPDTRPLISSTEATFLRRLEPLTGDTRRLLLLAAADPTGDIALLHHAAERLGIPLSAAGPAQAAGLVELGDRVRFAHPLIRSSVCRAAPVGDLQEVHRALAHLTDPDRDPDRRAWHLGQAAPGRDEEVAGELERCTELAERRGGPAAAAAFLARAAELTPDPRRRVDRVIAAARAEVQAGAYDPASVLLATAETGPADGLQRARIALLHAEIHIAADPTAQAPPLLLAAARRLEPFDAELAREAYLEALTAAIVTEGRGTGVDSREVAVAAQRAPRPDRPRTLDALLDGLSALLAADRSRSAVSTAQRAVRAFSTADLARPGTRRWLWTASMTAAALWDDEGWRALAARHEQSARETWAAGELLLALDSRVLVGLFTGDLAAAGALADERAAVVEGRRDSASSMGAPALAAWEGSGSTAGAVISAGLEDALSRGHGMAATAAHWAAALLCNSLGEYERALAAALPVLAGPPESAFANWALSELIEAAVRSGRPEPAEHAFGLLAETTRTGGTDWGLGMEARSRALLTADRSAERHYVEAVERLAGTQMRAELARSHLLYGEWLRRENRRIDARTQLHAAHDMFAGMGAAAFAERARRELVATGESVRRRVPETLAELTPQETEIARLAVAGHTNPEIGTALYISPRTVEWHLRKVFTKLGVTSRRQLGAALPIAPSPGGAG